MVLFSSFGCNWMTFISIMIFDDGYFVALFVMSVPQLCRERLQVSNTPSPQFKNATIKLPLHSGSNTLL